MKRQSLVNSSNYNSNPKRSNTENDGHGGERRHSRRLLNNTTAPEPNGNIDQNGENRVPNRAAQGNWRDLRQEQENSGSMLVQTAHEAHRHSRSSNIIRPRPSRSKSVSTRFLINPAQSNSTAISTGNIGGVQIRVITAPDVVGLSQQNRHILRASHHDTSRRLRSRSATTRISNNSAGNSSASRSIVAVNNDQDQGSSATTLAQVVQDHQQNSRSSNHVTTRSSRSSKISTRSAVNRVNTNNTAPIPAVIVVNAQRRARRNRVSNKLVQKRKITVPNEYILCLPMRTISGKCKEAIRCNQEGSMKLNPKLDFVSILSTKSDHTDEMKPTKNIKNGKWPVQYIIKCINKYFVLYEGWSASTIGDPVDIEELQETAAEKLKLAEVLHRFFEILVECKKKEYAGFSAEVKEQIKESDYCYKYPDFMRLRQNSHHSFWILLDISFFHSVILQEAGFAPVFYINGTGIRADKYPDYRIIVNNVMSYEVAEHLKKKKFSKHIKDLKGVQKSTAKTGCSSRSCVCNKRYDNLYGGSRRLVCNKNGILNMKDFVGTERNILVECSNACGCDKTCPNRQVQNGTKMTLAVVYEFDKGYCLRAMVMIIEGRFITEYLGVVKFSKEKSLDRSYEIGFHTFGRMLLIDALEFGNVARFPSHSCEPNCFFSEVHSRVEEGKVLVPRIALFAERNIMEGEELTVNYYPGAETPKDVTDCAECKCRSAKCIKFLPK